MALFASADTAAAIPSVSERTPADAQSWPKRFEVLPGETVAYGFVVGSPGAIDVSASWTGGPLVVTLTKPGGGVAAQTTGPDTAKLSYTATPVDVAKGLVWRVSMRSTPPPPAPPAPGAKPKPHDMILSTGTVTVHHPAGDVKAVKPRPERAVKEQAIAKAPLPPLPDLTAQRAILDAQRNERRAQLMKDLATHPAGPAPRALADMRAGMADPTITRLSTSVVRAGDPFRIEGTSLSAGKDIGVAHFVVASGADTKAVTTASAGSNELTVTVPDIVGVTQQTILVYVQRGATKSKPSSVVFVPTDDLAVLTPDIGGRTDCKINDPLDTWQGLVRHHDFTMLGDLFGAKADDEFFLTTRLKNGWVVDHVVLDGDISDSRDDAFANITETRVGTDSPYVKVHWWYLPDTYGVRFVPRIVIRGPKGVPYL